MMFRGARVKLRAFVREDMERQCMFENDPEMWFWDGGTPKPVSLERLLAGHDASLNSSSGDSVSFAIEVDGLYIGHCSLHNFDETSRNCELRVEIGDRLYWGKGYGREVVNILVDYAFKHRHMHRVWLKTHSENERAIRCYTACGFVEEGRLRQHIWINGRYVDRVFMGLLQEDLTA